MKNKRKDENFNFHVQVSSVSEISSDEWTGGGILTIDEAAIEEMTKDDEKPFFVEFVALYEGLSGNKNKYTEAAIKSCVKEMVGTNMYKGHVPPGGKDWMYREPVGKVISAKEATIVIDGKRVLAAKGKAYITDAEPKLRKDIKKGMAGPVSILGDARAIRHLTTGTREIVEIYSLKSIDFCNPGTAGMKKAGVTAIVTEMSGEPEIEKEDDKMERLTLKQLKEDYAEELKLLLAEMLEPKLNEFKSEFTKVEDDLKKSLEEKETSIQEMQSKLDTLAKEKEEVEKKFEKEVHDRLEAELKVLASEIVEEMKKDENIDTKVIEIACKDIEPTLIDNDLEKSKEAFKDRIKKEVEKTSILVKEIIGENNYNPSTKGHSKNQNTKAKNKLEEFLSPELRKAMKGKE